MTKNIYMIRHGQSVHNAVNNAFSGSTNVNISEEGMRQALSLKPFFDSNKVDVVYSSKLSRAIETAQLLFGEETTIHIEEMLREVDFGEYEGKYFEKDTSDIIYRQWADSIETLTFPGGDNVCKHVDNYYNTVLRIINESKEQSIAIVSHSASIRLFIAKVLGLPLKYFRRIPCDNCSVTKFQYDDELRMIYCNYRHELMR